MARARLVYILANSETRGFPRLNALSSRRR